MRPVENIKKLIQTVSIKTNPKVNKTVLNSLFDEQDKSRETSSVTLQPNIWRIIMKSRMTRFAAAAVITIAVFLAINIFHKPIPVISTASAAEVFAQSVAAMPKLDSVYITAQMRTNIEGDHFDAIDIDEEPVTVQMWKVFEGCPGKWRIEHPGKIAIMDGNSSFLYFPKSNWAKKGPPGKQFAGWLEDLLSIDYVVKQALLLAVQEAVEFHLTNEIGADGREKLVVSVEIEAKGDFTSSDYLRNKYIDESDTLRIYWFDSESKLLEGLEIYVHDKGRDVLVFDITDIEYNPEIDSNLFTLNLPEDVRWAQKPKDDWVYVEKYAKLTPKEMAIAFFQACSDENWEEYLEFSTDREVEQHTKDHLGGLKIISVGEPFKSGRYRGWFVPYEIELKSGEIIKWNLAVRNDNPAERYVVDGGI